MTSLRGFDPATYLTDDETIAHYLADAAQEDLTLTPSSKRWEYR